MTPQIKLVPSHDPCEYVKFYTYAGIPVRCGRKALAKQPGKKPLCKLHLELMRELVCQCREEAREKAKANTP